MPTPHPNHIIQPLERTPGALVENVYAAPGTLSMPDLVSQDAMGEYLMDRFTSPEGPRTRIILEETGKTLPGIEREIVGWKDKIRWEPDGWIISPKVSAGILIASMALGVAKPAAQDIGDEIHQLGHKIHRFFEPVTDTYKTTVVDVPSRGPVTHIRVDAEAGNTPGSSVVDPAAVDRFASHIARVVRKGGKIESVTITGRSSDDYGTNASIGEKEPKTEDFADERAAAYADALRQIDLATPSHSAELRKSLIIQKVDQNVLTSAEKTEVLEAAEKAGFTGPNNIIDAINNVQDTKSGSAKLRRLVTRLFIDRRGVTMDAAIDMPGKKTIEKVPVSDIFPGVDHPPKNPKRHYNLWPFTIPPIPRRRRVADGEKPIKRFHLTPRQPIYRPRLLREEADQVWLRIRPEAVQNDGTLVEAPWAYTRKFEYMLRDDRIKDVLKADFTDKQGQEKSLRIMFVDHAPAQETIDVFSELLKKFPAMQDGKLADRISGIFVYPSENAGRQHRDPKRVAMGVDQQSAANVLGTYTYALDLVELHMTSSWDQEELEQLFSSMEGANWTLVHEVAGHGADDSDEPLRLRRVLARGIPQAHVIDGEPRARRMQRLGRLLRQLPETPDEKVVPVQFDITYQTVDRDGEVVSLPARVFEGDGRLAHALTSSIVGHEPTRYSGESQTEHYAETAAATVTGIEIPYAEASVATPATLPRDNGGTARFAEGYRPASISQELFRLAVGADDGSFPAIFSNGPEVTIRHIAPPNDPFVRAHLQRTRRLPTMRPGDMIAILARVTQRSKKGEQA